MPVLAAIFDAFGTLVKIGVGTNPYRKILRVGIEQGRRPKVTDAEDLLSMPLDLRQAADYFGISIGGGFMNQLEDGLREELASKAAPLLNLSTIVEAEISNPPWVKFQSAGWVSFQSAPTPGA